MFAYPDSWDEAFRPNTQFTKTVVFWTFVPAVLVGVGAAFCVVYKLVARDGDIMLAIPLAAVGCAVIYQATILRGFVSAARRLVKQGESSDLLIAIRSYVALFIFSMSAIAVSMMAFLIFFTGR